MSIVERLKSFWESFVSKARTVLREKGSITVSFVIALPVIIGLIGIGVDSSTHAYFQQHEANILDTAMKGGAQYVHKNGTIDVACAYGAALQQYASNRDNVAARAGFPDDVEAGETLSSAPNKIGIVPKSCSLSNFSVSQSVTMSTNPKDQFVIKSFSVTQPHISESGQIAPGTIKMCVREKHKTFFLGVMLPRLQTLDATICSSASNIMAK